MQKQRITFDELESYIRAIDRATDLESILNILQKQIEIFGFNRMTYWVRWPSFETKKPVFISTYPDVFINHYLENDFQSHDMVGRLSNEKNTPFAWSHIEDTFEVTRMQKVLFDASQSVGMKAGGSIPIHGPLQIKATFSVTNDLSQKDFDELFLFHRHELHILATYAHEKIMSFGIDDPIRNINLTARETEILAWVARGKTYWEIGEILSIQEDTVKKTMFNLFKKLNVSNKSHAVAKAVIYGLIIP